MLLWILLLALLPASALADAGSEARGCEEEVALSRAAAELLLEAQPPAPEALTAAARAAGSDAVSLRAYFAPDGDTRPDAWLAQLRREADAPLACGVARSERGQLWLAAPRAGSLELVRGGERAILRGRLAPDFRDPELVVQDAHGTLARLVVEPELLARGVPVSDELARPARVQLLAHGPNGPRPIAERVLPDTGAGTRRVAEPREPPAREGVSLQERLGALRSEHGLSAPRPHRLLSEVAAAHARQVCERGRVAHELEPGANPEQRLRAAGVLARRIGETVARAASAAEAFSAFERSPSHRFTLLEPSFTDAGIGEAVDSDGKSCVVVLLAAWPRFVGR